MPKPLPIPNPNDGRPHTFELGAEHFLLDGSPIVLFSGEMHPQRIPHEYWRHRLRMARAMGLNAVAVYMFWNAIEREEGVFDFSKENDFARFMELAQEEGLWVILRPGPYCCAEWDFGGLPPYLLKDGNLRVRCMYSPYIEAVKRYIAEWSKILTLYQAGRGGPILMVQVENEYGSYGSDKAYLRTLVSFLRDAGWEVPLFTCDGSGDHYLVNGTLPELLAGVNFGDRPDKAFAQLEKHRGKTPKINVEYYTGWFVHWGNLSLIRTTPVKINRVISDLKYMCERDISWNLYMFHGGTNWGYFAGANLFDAYKPDITSYDYGAPLDEAGRPTAQYFAIRSLLRNYLPPNTTLPDPQEIMEELAPRLIETPILTMEEFLPLMEFLEEKNKGIEGIKVIEDCCVRPMESYGHFYGMILYRHRLVAANMGRTLIIKDVHDYAMVYLNGKRIAIIDRRRLKERPARIKLPHAPPGCKPDDTMILDIFVESHGRVNYGSHLIDRKGIIEFVSLDNVHTLMNWEIYLIRPDKFAETIPFKPIPSISGLKETDTYGPVFYRTTLRIEKEEERGDFYLDMSLWTKGMVWVNGHNLGRYWSIGPQYRLYVPAAWLHVGENTITILEMEGLNIMDKKGALSLTSVLKTFHEAGLQKPSYLNAIRLWRWRRKVRKHVKKEKRISDKQQLGHKPPPICGFTSMQ